MAEATLDPKEAAALRDAARALERARLGQIASFHFVLLMGAITLWGAAATWAGATDWGLAGFAALANAVIAGFVVPSVLHEWGHYTGARLAGATVSVLEAPRRHFFFFDFPLEENDTRAFLWMSWGGILAPWAVLLAAAALVPSGVPGGSVLLATLLFKAVGTSAFEVPVARRAATSGEPGVELGRQVTGGGLPRSRRVGALAGAALFALLWLTA